MITRLRPAHSPEVLAAMYAVPHDHTRWADHMSRVAQTIAWARELLPAPASVADLSCGDAAIPLALAACHGRVVLGDLAPGYEVTGPIEETVEDLDPGVDLFVCCETLEHLDHPGAVLAQIRGKARHLLLSTPLAEPDAGNPEHYWSWDDAGIATLLRAAGWEWIFYRTIDHPLATYQVWGCR